jgi:Flp pilus assembly pilin Flp
VGPPGLLKSLIRLKKERVPVSGALRGIVRPQTDVSMSESRLAAQEEMKMYEIIHTLLKDEQGQDIAEYAVMLAVILVIVVGTIRLIGSNANNVFSQAASSIQ